MNYVPHTILANAPWPKYKPAKVEAMPEPDKPKRKSVSEIVPPRGETARIFEYIKSHRWTTCYQVAQALDINIKRVTTRVAYHETTGRLLAKRVPSVRGEAFGYMINEYFRYDR